MSEFHRFKMRTFELLCEHAVSGDLDSIQQIVDDVPVQRRASRTFCPNPKRHLSTPFILAAQYGRLNVVRYFVDKLGDIIDVNHVGTIVSRTTKKKVHHATALWAASTGGHLNIVKFLTSHGADVNKPTLTRSTPLRGASFHGYIEVMDFLLEQGADINTPNCIGQSPLCIAAMRGELQAVQFLLERGANVKQKTINGYTVMHLAAAKGKCDVIDVLLSMGVSPEFIEANPFQKDYISCPMLLAASAGHQEAVELFCELAGCPQSCKADAYLLLAAMQCELRRRLRITDKKIQQLWETGLLIRSENSIVTQNPLPIAEYDFRTEIKSKEELQALWHTPDFAYTDAFYQSLLIRERCMGFLDQGLIYFLIRRGSYFCHDGRSREAELLWSRAIKLEIMVCESEINHLEYGHCEGIQRDLEKDLSIFADGVHVMVLNSNYKPDFARYICYGIKELEMLSQLSSKADFEVVDSQVVLNLIMDIFLSWIEFDCRRSTSKNNKLVCSRECHNLGCKFVSDNLVLPSGSTLLHEVLTNFEIGDDRHVLDRHTDLRPLITALLEWGADAVIDRPDQFGNRPVHVAINFNESETVDTEVLSPLLASGVHIDAVDSNGHSYLDLCQNDMQKALFNSFGPLSLACYCARAVIAEGLACEHIGLPHHVVELVKLHDCKHVTIEEDPSIV